MASQIFVTSITFFLSLLFCNPCFGCGGEGGSLRVDEGLFSSP